MQKAMLDAVSRSFLPKCRRVNFRALKALPQGIQSSVLRATGRELSSVHAEVCVISSPRDDVMVSLEPLRTVEDWGSDHVVEESEVLINQAEEKVAGPLVKPHAKRLGVGAFQQLPVVSPSYEIHGSAVRKARIVRPTKGIANVAKRERNRGAKQLDTLTKELSMPLKRYVQKFPDRQHFHPYERALLELTLGEGKYEEVLQSVDLLRKKVLDVGKNRASLCAKSTTRKEAEERVEEGFKSLEEIFNSFGKSVDNLKEIAKVLRIMPVVHPRVPTLCLVGAPNVGKSSLVRILSSGKPEVCNYPFTTRGISMGHIVVDSEHYQVTDTPGILRRPDEKRNNMEKLTLAALSYLPTAVLYVHDLTGDCGTSVMDQWHLYKELRTRFAERPWIDVVSKADMLPPPPFPTPSDEEEHYSVCGPAGAIRISVKTEEGVQELSSRVRNMLTTQLKQLGVPDESSFQRDIPPMSTQSTYFPAWPPPE